MLTLDFESIKDGWSLHNLGDRCILVHKGSLGVNTYHGICPHQAVRFQEGDTLFCQHDYWVCPKHGAFFDHDGFCISGPCQGEYLTPIESKLIGPHLVLNVDEL